MIFVLLNILLVPLSVFADEQPLPLAGSWKAIGYYYEEQFIQPPDPQLTLTFDFFEDGTHRLFWKMKGETSFCERKGLWRLEKDQLFIEVTWVNPENGPSCSSDPDMQNGLKTQSTISINNNQLFVQIPFAESHLIYVWDSLPEPIR